MARCSMLVQAHSGEITPTIMEAPTGVQLCMVKDPGVKLLGRWVGDEMAVPSLPQLWEVIGKIHQIPALSSLTVEIGGEPVPLWDRDWWSSPLHRGLPTHPGMVRCCRHCPSHGERDQCLGNQGHGLHSTGCGSVCPSCPRTSRPHLSWFQLLDQGKRFPPHQHSCCLLEASASPPHHHHLPEDYFWLGPGGSYQLLSGTVEEMGPPFHP